MPNWTPEQDAILRQMVEAGSTAAQVSARLPDFSRCAVVGRMHRLKIKSKNGHAHRDGGRPKKAKAAPRPKTRAPAVRKAAPDFGRVETFVEKAHDDAPPPRMLPLVDLTTFDCRWPIGDPRNPGFGFCGHATERAHGYCPFHAGLAYQARAA